MGGEANNSNAIENLPMRRMEAWKRKLKKDNFKWIFENR